MDFISGRGAAGFVSWTDIGPCRDIPGHHAPAAFESGGLLGGGDGGEFLVFGDDALGAFLRELPEEVRERHPAPDGFPLESFHFGLRQAPKVHG